MKSLLLPFCAWFAATVVSAQPAKQIITARSYSGQFTALEMRGRPVWAPSPIAARVPIAGGMAFLVTSPPLSPAAQSDKIPLSVETLPVSCERIKELFLLELGLQDEWLGKVRLILNASLPEDREPLLTAIYHPEGWSYELELPKKIRQEFLVRSVIQTLLEELVNRQSGSTSAVVPYWLVEGFSAHVQAFNLPTFILQPNSQSAGYHDMTIEGLDGVRAGLRQHTPLTFQQLSWPEQSDVAGKDEAVYRNCAQLLFENLLHLNDGQVCLQRMLKEMPDHLNWQTSFLQAFHSHFSRMLDVEKWWALSCVGFTASDGTEQACWQKLQDALDVPVEVHLDPSRMPAAACLTLQEVIMQWNASEAQSAVLRAVHALEGLQLFNFRCDLNLDASGVPPVLKRNAQNVEASHWHIGRELNPLAARYLTVLLNYLKQSEHDAPVASQGKFSVPRLLLLKRETVRQLNSLDQERDAMRAQFASSSSVPPSPFHP